MFACGADLSLSLLPPSALAHSAISFTSLRSFSHCYVRSALAHALSFHNTSPSALVLFHSSAYRLIGIRRSVNRPCTFISLRLQAQLTALLIRSYSALLYRSLRSHYNRSPLLASMRPCAALRLRSPCPTFFFCLRRQGGQGSLVFARLRLASLRCASSLRSRSNMCAAYMLSSFAFPASHRRLMRGGAHFISLRFISLCPLLTCSDCADVPCRRRLIAKPATVRRFINKLLRGLPGSICIFSTKPVKSSILCF